MLKKFNYTYKGLIVGLLIVLLWASVLIYNLNYDVDYFSLKTYLLILLQSHLYTGLFITAHDAMHGTVVPHNPKMNHSFGKICTLLFMFNNYEKLLSKHHKHHRFAGTEKDPDYHKGNEHFLAWFIQFSKEYVTISQLIIITVTLQLLRFIFPLENLILFWCLPSFFSTLQLFIFGTYLPHRGEHDKENKHRSRSQKQNHFLAFMSCYFFGYHYEHHDSPHTPWWKLWEKKTA